MKDNKQYDANEMKAKDSRRKFLVKGAATTLVATLPVKTSWASGKGAAGCAVSGNLSGNQSAVCETTQVSGKSPDGWHDDCKSGRSRSSVARSARRIEWREVFSSIPSSGSSSSYRSNNSGNKGVQSSSSLEDILENGGEIERHLVAGYLNALDDRYPLKVDVTPEMYALMLEEEANNDQFALIKALEQTYVY